MANIDVTELLSDPDFSDDFGLIVRASTVDAKGRNILTESDVAIVSGVVQDADVEELQKYPDLASLSNVIAVWYEGRLNVESLNGYSDIIVWGGARFEAKQIHEDWMNYGSGWTKAFCVPEKVNNNA